MPNQSHLSTSNPTNGLVSGLACCLLFLRTRRPNKRTLSGIRSQPRVVSVLLLPHASTSGIVSAKLIDGFTRLLRVRKTCTDFALLPRHFLFAYESHSALVLSSSEFADRAFD